MPSGHRQFGINRFGISDEELDYDENDPSWYEVSPGSDVFIGQYDSAKPFVEKLQHRQTALLEEIVEERRTCREALREKILREFEEKLKQFEAKFQLKPPSPLIIEKILTLEADELKEWQKFSVRRPSRFENGSESACYELAKQSSLSKSSSSWSANRQLPAEFTVDCAVGGSVSSTSSESPSLKWLHAESPKTFTKPSSNAFTTPLRSPSIPERHQQSEISFSFVLPPHKCSTPIATAAMQSSKIGHAALTRTNSVSSCRSTASRSISWSVQQIPQETHDITNEVCTSASDAADEQVVQCTSAAAGTTETTTTFQLASVVSDEESTFVAFENCDKHHPFYAEEIAFTKQFMTEITAIPDVIKNKLKCTIKEKISISTKKFAKQSDIAQIVRFFSNLLNGITVYGFSDKMINLKDNKVAINWAMIYIIDTYVDLVPQDLGLLKVIVAVLSSLASSNIFSKLLIGKLFITSPLLSVNFNECVRRILNMRRSQRFVEALASWNRREIAIIRLFIALKIQRFEGDNESNRQENDGIGFLWKFIVATVSEDTPFAAVLVSEILKHCWKIMYNVYGRQMEKLVILIDEKVVPRWKVSLNKLKDTEIVRIVAEQYITTLKFTVDECLSSINQ